MQYSGRDLEPEALDLPPASDCSNYGILFKLQHARVSFFNIPPASDASSYLGNQTKNICEISKPTLFHIQELQTKITVRLYHTHREGGYY